MKVESAVIPSAGMGTRLYPASNHFPKELLPIGKYPMLWYAIREAANAEFENIIVVTNPRKKSLINYMNSLKEEDWLRNSELVVAIQESPNGLALAILEAAKLIKYEPLMVILPDNVVIGTDYPTRRLVQAAERYDAPVISLMLVESDQQAKLLGNCGHLKVENSRENECLRIIEISSKGPGCFELTKSKPEYRITGRFIVEKRFYEITKALRYGSRDEIDDVEVFQSMLHDSPVCGIHIPSVLFDVGNPDGYIYAQRSWMEFELNE